MAERHEPDFSATPHKAQHRDSLNMQPHMHATLVMGPKPASSQDRGAEGRGGRALLATEVESLSHGRSHRTYIYKYYQFYCLLVTPN